MAKVYTADIFGEVVKPINKILFATTWKPSNKTLRPSITQKRFKIGYKKCWYPRLLDYKWWLTSKTFFWS